MEGYITFSQLGLLTIVMVVLVTGSHAVMTLRSVNAAVKDIGKILKENQGPFSQAMPNIAAASENVVAITNDLRSSLGETSKANETADQIATYAVVIGEAAKALANIFASTRKH
jgi:glucan phosphoethanolaminetransferase (alkaline phosphatase superfamily)